MNDRKLLVQEIGPDEIRNVASIHTKSFPGFFLTLLGQKFLEQYYHIVLTENFGVIWGLRNTNMELIGFAAVVDDPQKFYRAVGANKIRLGLLALSHAARHPSTWPKFFSRIRAARHRESLDQRAGHELISIAVLPGYSGLGAGQSLISAIFEDIARCGGGALRLRTDRHNNDQVRRFYAKNGFEVAGLELIGTREMLLLQREIGPKQ